MESRLALDDTCVLYIDGGTMRTRAWAAVGERVGAAERVTAGAGDTAREDSSRRLTDALHQRIRRSPRTTKGLRQHGVLGGGEASMEHEVPRAQDIEQRLRGRRIYVPDADGIEVRLASGDLRP